jgi:hypothetical protein
MAMLSSRRRLLLSTVHTYARVANTYVFAFTENYLFLSFDDGTRCLTDACDAVSRNGTDFVNRFFDFKPAGAPIVNFKAGMTKRGGLTRNRCLIRKASRRGKRGSALVLTRITWHDRPVICPFNKKMIKLGRRAFGCLLNLST